VVRDHHADDLESGNLLLDIVRLVNLVARKLGFGIHHEPGLELAMTEEARNLGMGELMLAELEIYMEDKVPEVVNSMSMGPA
jgi:dihydroxyacetone kinase